MIKVKKENKAARTALAGMLSALEVVFLFVGTATGIMDLTGICAASLLTAVAVVELGGAYPYLIWAVTGAIAFILLPDKSVAAGYVLFGGVYPMLKLYFEKLRRGFEWILKLCYGIAVIGALYVLSRFVFAMPQESLPIMIGLGIGYAVFFVIYDYALSVAMTLYMRRLRPKLTFLRKI